MGKFSFRIVCQNHIPFSLVHTFLIKRVFLAHARSFNHAGFAYLLFQTRLYNIIISSLVNISLCFHLGIVREAIHFMNKHLKSKQFKYFFPYKNWNYFPKKNSQFFSFLIHFQPINICWIRTSSEPC